METFMVSLKIFSLFDDGSFTHLIMDIVVFWGLMELNRENRGIQQTNQGRS
jgi:CHASE3 domain sensor protein